MPKFDNAISHGLVDTRFVEWRGVARRVAERRFTEWRGIGEVWLVQWRKGVDPRLASSRGGSRATCGGAWHDSALIRMPLVMHVRGRAHTALWAATKDNLEC